MAERAAMLKLHNAKTIRIPDGISSADAVYVLHAFQKKTQATSKSDIDLAKERYTELMRGRK